MKRCLTVLLLLAAVCLPLSVGAEEAADSRICFLLMCNEGLQNDGGNVGNTMMVVSLDTETGGIRLCVFTWDTFITLEGYDTPQLIDQPYRVSGPEGTLRAFNENFGQNIDKFMSADYLNLANLIDTYGGLDVDVTRAERNALNGMVAAKKENIEAMAEIGVLEQMLVEKLVEEYYLDEYGADTHLNGLQSVGFGWLQYDSVYNCCLREGAVISELFGAVGDEINCMTVLYTDSSEKPDPSDSRRAINLDDPTQDDLDFLYNAVRPIFDKTYHNLDKSDVEDITLAFGRAAYAAANGGIDVFHSVECRVMPLEANGKTDIVAGRRGHLVDYESNAAAITEFLYGE